MSLLTLFTSPKAFEDPHVTVIQRNAIQSWCQLGEEVEVLLMGNDAGVIEAAAEFGVQHVPDVACSSQGIPLISDMFAQARQRTDSPVLAIINTDIILLPDFLETVRQAQSRYQAFVLAGQRWDLDVTEPIGFGPGWQARLMAQVAQQGVLHPPSGSDYFIFSRQVLTEIPDFTIGRAGWDNWMIYHAAHQPWQTLDATHDITVVHQNHDYGHLPGGQIHYKLPDSKKNVQLGGGEHQMFDLLDLQFALVDGEVQRIPLNWLRFVRKIERLLQPTGEIRGVRGRLFRMVRRYRKKIAKGNGK